MGISHEVDLQWCLPFFVEGRHSAWFCSNSTTASCELQQDEFGSRC